MSNLVCDANNCRHNLDGCCTAGAIEVQSRNAGDDTECKTFAQKDLMESTSRFFNVNLKEGYTNIFSGQSSDMSPDIRCEAYQCKYNSNRLCKADNVEIIGDMAGTSSDTKCETFQLEK